MATAGNTKKYSKKNISFTRRLNNVFSDKTKFKFRWIKGSLVKSFKNSSDGLYSINVPVFESEALFDLLRAKALSKKKVKLFFCMYSESLDKKNKYLNALLFYWDRHYK